jgi:hypothetical protein
MNNRVIFRKIPLELLIETLIDIQSSGANYIDIIGVQNDVQDVVTISVQREYLSNSEENVEDVDFINDKLSDEDINDLMI